MQLTSPSSDGPCPQTYIDQADDTIIRGESRICRLAMLRAAMADRGYCTGRIDKLMTDHEDLMRSWIERRAAMMERLVVLRIGRNGGRDPSPIRADVDVGAGISADPAELEGSHRQAVQLGRTE